MNGLSSVLQLGNLKQLDLDGVFLTYDPILSDDLEWPIVDLAEAFLGMVSKNLRELALPMHIPLDEFLEYYWQIAQAKGLIQTHPLVKVCSLSLYTRLIRDEELSFFPKLFPELEKVQSAFHPNPIGPLVVAYLQNRRDAPEEKELVVEFGGKRSEDGQALLEKVTAAFACDIANVSASSDPWISELHFRTRNAVVNARMQHFWD